MKGSESRPPPAHGSALPFRQTSAVQRRRRRSVPLEGSRGRSSAAHADRVPRGHLMSGRSRRGQLARWLLLLPLLLALGCSDGKKAATPPMSSSSAASTSTTSPGTSSASSTDVGADVTKAYLAYWDMYLRVNNPPSPDDPQIAQLTTGPALPALRDVIVTNRAQGLVLQAPPGGPGPHTVRLQSIDGSVAKLSDCAVDNLEVVRASSGEVVNKTIVTKLISAVLVNDAGRWKVSQYDFLKRWDGVTSCDAPS